MKDNRITIRAILLGALLAAAFAWYTVLTENVGVGRRILTATQIPVLPYLMLIVMACLLNPLLRRLRVVRALSVPEIMIIFVMTMVSAGVSTFGLASQLVPVVGGLLNRDWNTAQARWDRYIQPFVSETYFVSEPGIRQASSEALEAENAWRQADAVLRAARLLRNVEQSERETSDLLSAEPASGAGRLYGAERQRMIRYLAMERERLAYAEALWDPYEEEWERDQVLEVFPEKVAALHQEYVRRREVLRALEETAFEKVEAFRVGLPDELRAVPGILPVGGERLVVYRTRLRRMRVGLNALNELRAAETVLAEAGAVSVPDGFREPLRRADAQLRDIAETDELLEQRDVLRLRRDSLENSIDLHRSAIERERDRRRYADASEFSAIDRSIDALQADLDKLLNNLDDINDDIRRSIDPRLRMAQEIEEIRAGLTELDAALDDGITAGQAGESLQAAIVGLEALHISWQALIAGNVPWEQWGGALGRWMLLALLAYIMLMTFNSLIFRQWAHHEKLVYPLAELPMQLGGIDQDSDGRAPAIYRTGLFWAGVAVSCSVLGWNIMATRQIIPGINPIQLYFSWAPYITNSVFEGLLPNAHHQVFFTLIGISFLVPARISKSLWGFHILYMFMLLVMVWMGYGSNELSFPAGMNMVLNFRTAIGGGALIAFSSATLWKCRRYIFCGPFPAVLEGLSDSERRELRISSVMFMASSLALIGLLSFGMGANIFFAIFCYLVIIIITIGMVRAVAEGGLLVFQCWFNPFHIIRSAFGMHRTWTAPSLLAPLVIFYYIMFWDLKTFIAPAMANALKIRDSLGLQRLRFHTAVWIGIGAAMITALATHVILGYHHGANSMHSWFYESGPRNSLFGWIKDMAIANPIDQAGGLYWMLTGIAVMSLLLTMRRRRFWLPHPIGLVMWVNPVMWAFWFSILLGWIFKTLVSRYGDRSTYLKFRDFFIGLIVGELIMCLFGVDLNRN